MKSTAGFRLGTALAAVLALAVAAPPAAEAGVTGSAHDFTALAITTQGPCSACHIPHFSSSQATGAILPTLPGSYAAQFRMWVRDLTNEASYFDQYNTDPNYLPSPTIYCYDCHENQSNEIESSSDIDSPPNSVWALSSFHGNGEPGYPQDIALGDYGVNQSSGVNVGYYELADGSLPSTGGPTDGSPTGGHYWKRSNADLSGTPAYRQGDKLDCNICHDIHDTDTGSNDVLFRERFWDGNNWQTHSEPNLTASTFSRAHATDSPATYTGRSMCAQCHSYSNTTGYTDAPTQPIEMWGSGTSAEVPRPPAIMPQHDSGNAYACTCCHDHNKVDISCNDCHGFPPTVATPFDAQSNPNGESYAGGAGAHQRHIDALGPIFECTLCHGPEAGNQCAAPWHNEGNGTVISTNVDIIGHGDYWDTGDRAGHTAVYAGTASGENPSATDNTVNWEPVAKGGGDRRCATLTCHGDPPDVGGALNWSDDMVNETTGLPETDFRICKWCHEGINSTLTVSSIDGGTTWAPNMMGNGTFGAETSGHGLTSGNYDQEAIGDGLGPPAANIECYICHDGTYTGAVPTRTHFGAGTDPRDEARLRDTINGAAIGVTTTYPTGPDQACEACHQNGNATDGPDWSHHGNDPAGGYIALEGSFLRTCRQCHEVHGRNWNGGGRNLHMIGNWIDASGDGVADAGEGARVDSNATGEIADITTLDNAVVFTSFTGNNSFNDTQGTPSDDLCETCHGAGTGGGDHGGTPNINSDERGNDCTDCHDHDFDDNYVTPDAFMPSACEGCHGENDVVHPGLDETMGTDDDAPHVMRFWTGSQAGVQDGGHGDPDGQAAVECRDCHDISLPSGTHLDGTVNSVWHNDDNPSGTYERNENTAHMRDIFMFGSNVTDHRVQTTFDDACYNTCHAGLNIPDMRHSISNPTPNAMQFGRKLTFSNGDDINNTGDGASGRDTATSASLTDSDYWPIEIHPDWPPSLPASQSWTRERGSGIWLKTWPIDKDLSNNAQGGTDYGTCVSCHDPHGSGISEPGKTPKMMRDNWITGGQLCMVCH